MTPDGTYESHREQIEAVCTRIMRRSRSPRGALLAFEAAAFIGAAAERNRTFTILRALGVAAAVIDEICDVPIEDVLGYGK